MAYQGEGSYAGLKIAAVVSVILAGVLAVALWLGADDPRIEIDSSGRPSITTDADPAVIATGVLVLGEGLLFGLVLWAIGTIGSHVVELRKQIAPIAEQRTVASSSTATNPLTYSVVLKDLGRAKPDHVRRLVRGFTNDKQDPDPATLQQSDVIIATGLSYANAEPLRTNLIQRGAEAELREED